MALLLVNLFLFHVKKQSSRYFRVGGRMRYGARRATCDFLALSVPSQ